MSEVKAYLFVIRHGETDYNRARRIQGQTDIPLNENGIKQAGYTAAELSKERLDVIASSDLQRAIKTADIIRDAQIQDKKPIRVISKNFRELSFGDFDTHYLDDGNEVAIEFKRVWELWGQGDVNAKCPNGESPAEVRDRMCPEVIKLLEEVCSKEPIYPKNVAIVAHGRCIKTTLSTLLSMSTKDIEVSNVSINKLEWYGGYNFKVVYMNKTDHIKCDQLPSTYPFLQK